VGLGRVAEGLPGSEEGTVAVEGRPSLPCESGSVMIEVGYCIVIDDGGTGQGEGQVLTQQDGYLQTRVRPVFGQTVRH